VVGVLRNRDATERIGHFVIRVMNRYGRRHTGEANPPHEWK